ncbi:hypothetical protein ACQJBY_006042 [Aegilops geniculata]
MADTIWPMNARPVCRSLSYGQSNLVPHLYSTQATFIQTVRHCLISQEKDLQPGCIKAYARGEQITNKLGEPSTEEAAWLWRSKDDVDAMVDKMQDLEAVYTIQIIAGPRRKTHGSCWAVAHKIQVCHLRRQGCAERSGRCRAIKEEPIKGTRLVHCPGQRSGLPQVIHVAMDFSLSGVTH